MGNVDEPEEVKMKVEALTQKAEEEIAALIAKRISELRKKTGKEVSEIQFIARESMAGLEGYEVKIKLI
ncbi:hypothetical protein FHW22_001081|jgi:hypothetical protein|nr:hypothetical protein [Enterobacter ludwigii]